VVPPRCWGSRACLQTVTPRADRRALTSRKRQRAFATGAAARTS
jgi:hypothetical protein